MYISIYLPNKPLIKLKIRSSSRPDGNIEPRDEEQMMSTTPLKIATSSEIISNK